MKKGYPKVHKYKVMVQCCTYNQSHYIEDSLRGFSMQQTNFPFVCCVFDDASTDGEQEVLKTWINNHCNTDEISTFELPLTDIFIASDKDNPNCIYVFHLQKINTWGKPEKLEMISFWINQCDYITLCEGDDYWTDSLKLQKQVDFMEINNEYTCCFHSYSELHNTGKEINIRRYTTNNYDVPLEDLIKGGGGFVATNSIIYPRSILADYPDWARLAPVGDLPLELFLFSKGKVAYFIDNMSTYRVMATGSWSQSMANSYKNSLRVLRSEIKIWKDFDKWSSFKYHQAIKKRFRKMYLNFLKYTLRCIINLVRRIANN